MTRSVCDLLVPLQAWDGRLGEGQVESAQHREERGSLASRVSSTLCMMSPTILCLVSLEGGCEIGVIRCDGEGDRLIAINVLSGPLSQGSRLGANLGTISKV